MKDLDDFVMSAFAPLAEGEKVAMAMARLWRAADGNERIAFKPRSWRARARWTPLGLHVNCSAFRLKAVRAVAADATRTFIVVLDDVGNISKKSVCSLDRVLALPVPPHAVISTRVDAEEHINTQVHYFIELRHRPGGGAGRGRLRHRHDGDAHRGRIRRRPGGDAGRGRLRRRHDGDPVAVRSVPVSPHLKGHRP
jgi:hypothetical protein